ncbi:hypothetical protein ElyMa_001491800 [Elysia marginata]|uniref:Uncharacterized protein n=1 Tax=Elysia marginata TaxID=1093978 RepID=A0AAV4J5U6_9GAST|nr:hypothetical protein ElyMa_001491800 [Elysia marginata]
MPCKVNARGRRLLLKCGRKFYFQELFGLGIIDPENHQAVGCPPQQNSSYLAATGCDCTRLSGERHLAKGYPSFRYGEKEWEGAGREGGVARGRAVSGEMVKLSSNQSNKFNIISNFTPE